MARKKSSNNYFTKETENYIVKYNISENQEYRNDIFTKHIYYPFYKLAENIIHTFKFYYTDVDQIEDLKHQVVSMLLEEKIMKFDATHGAKAYSYFGTIVKRWLINYNNKNYKKLKRIGSFDDIEESYEKQKVSDLNGLTLKQFLDIWVAKTDNELDTLFPKPSEKRIADAILTVFKRRYDLDIFKKKALYIYVREMTDCETPHLTKVVSKLKIDFYTLYEDYSSKDRLAIK
tara:strand:+ start:325 stop:1020 length:696 start_codon:yes stop_codon:yes gene_type:complete